MKPIRSLMAPMQADRLYMAVATDDLFEAINVPLRARKGAFALSYLDHQPRLYLVCDGSAPELIAFVDTRRRCSVWSKPITDPLQLMLGDIYRRLDVLGGRLGLIVQKDRQGRSLAKLQISADDSRHIVLTLATVPRHKAESRIGPFILRDAT